MKTTGVKEIVVMNEKKITETELVNGGYGKEKIQNKGQKRIFSRIILMLIKQQNIKKRLG